MTVLGLVCKNPKCAAFGEPLAEAWGQSWGSDTPVLLSVWCDSCDYRPDEAASVLQGATVRLPIEPPRQEEIESLRERVLVLTEAAERARLLLHLLPDRLDGCRSAGEAARTTAETLYEAEAVLFYGINGEEMRSEPDEGVSVAFPKVSERSETISDDSVSTLKRVIHEATEADLLRDWNDSGTVEL